MSFEDAVATQPMWVQLWINWLFIGAFVLPLTLLIWKPTRWFGAGFFVATVLGALTIMWLYNVQGYTRLLGLPHLIVWIPGAVLIWRKLQTDLPQIPRVILWVILATITISLAFDIVDVARYFMGERGSMVPAEGG